MPVVPRTADFLVVVVGSGAEHAQSVILQRLRIRTPELVAPQCTVID